MTFAEQVRRELSEIPVKKPCCRRALTAGLLLPARLSETEKNTVRVRYLQEEPADLSAALLQAQYTNPPAREVTGACGHRYFDLSVSSAACAKFVRAMQTPTADAGSLPRFSCENCRQAFLRGAFLASGTVNDPHKSFHLEFKLQNPAVCDLFSDFLSSVGYPPRRVTREGSFGLYYKESGAVEELITLMGSHHVIFEVINNRIEREIRNNENRATNCVTRNMEKTISAAAQQLDAINKLMEAGKLEGLPEPLRVTAMQRYRNPDISLDELAGLHDPPLSRSGLNHRLQKLLQAAEDL